MWRSSSSGVVSWIGATEWEKHRHWVQILTPVPPMYMILDTIVFHNFKMRIIKVLSGELKMYCYIVELSERENSRRKDVHCSRRSPQSQKTRVRAPGLAVTGTYLSEPQFLSNKAIILPSSLSTLPLGPGPCLPHCSPESS